MTQVDSFLVFCKKTPFKCLKMETSETKCSLASFGLVRLPGKAQPVQEVFEAVFDTVVKAVRWNESFMMCTSAHNSENENKTTCSHQLENEQTRLPLKTAVILLKVFILLHLIATVWLLWHNIHSVFFLERMRPPSVLCCDAKPKPSISSAGYPKVYGYHTHEWTKWTIICFTNLFWPCQTTC